MRTKEGDMKDLCLNCGTEHKNALWGAKCDCGAPNTVHQYKCDGCGQIVGIIIDDDFCGLEKVYCSNCINKVKNNTTQFPLKKEL